VAAKAAGVWFVATDRTLWQGFVPCALRQALRVF